MPLTSFLLASIISFLGLVAGMIIMQLAPEEQKPGRRYFMLLENTLFVAVLGLFLYYQGLHAIIVSVLVVIALGYTIAKNVEMRRHEIVYLFFGFIVALSYPKENLLLIESLLIFAYGMSAASLMYAPKEKNYVKIVMKHSLFFIPIVVIPFFL